MNDYTAGALEALTYALAILDKHFPEEDRGPVVDAYAEIEESQLKLLKGTVRSFRDRISLIPTNPLH